MLKTRMVEAKTGRDLHTHDGWDGDPVLVTTTHGRYAGNFKSQILATAGTFDVVAPNGNDGVILTDVIISAEKKNAGLITLRFSDGVETETMLLSTLTDAPVNMAIAFQGHWQGWQAAAFQVVTNLDFVGCVSVGYFKIDQSVTLPYDEWDERR